jgi:hypothetical protein
LVCQSAPDILWSARRRVGERGPSAYQLVGVDGQKMNLPDEHIESRALPGEPGAFSEWGPEEIQK